jgi:hypothetical protein
MTVPSRLEIVEEFADPSRAASPGPNPVSQAVTLRR